MISYVISMVMTLISGVLLAVVKGLIDDNKRLKEKKRSEEEIRNKAMQDGIMLLLRVQLIKIHDEYVRDGNGIIPTDAYNNFTEMFEAYTALGGNGMVTHVKVTFSEPVISNMSPTSKFELVLASQTDSSWFRTATCTISSDYLTAICTYKIVDGDDTGTDKLEKSIYVLDFESKNLYDKSNNQLSDYTNSETSYSESKSTSATTNVSVKDSVRNIHTPKDTVIIVDTLAPVMSINRSDPTVNLTNGNYDFYVKDNDVFTYTIVIKDRNISQLYYMIKEHMTFYSCVGDGSGECTRYTSLTMKENLTSEFEISDLIESVEIIYEPTSIPSAEDTITITINFVTNTGNGIVYPELKHDAIYNRMNTLIDLLTILGSEPVLY